MATTTLYAFTIKDNTQPEEDQVKTIFTHWRKKGVIIKQSYQETVSGIHYHGIIEVPNHVYRRNLTLKGWHMKLKPIYNLTDWEEYITKEQILTDPDTNDNSIMAKLSKPLFNK